MTLTENPADVSATLSDYEGDHTPERAQLTGIGRALPDGGCSVHLFGHNRRGPVEILGTTRIANFEGTIIRRIGKKTFREKVSLRRKLPPMPERVGDDLGPAASYVRTLLRDLRVDSSMPLLLSAYGVLPKKEFGTVVKWVLVFVARYSIVLGFDSGGMENIFYALARDVRKSVAGMNEKTSPKDLAIIYGGTLTLIKNTLAKNAPTDDQIKASAAKLILDPEEAKYIVHRLAKHMQTKTKEMSIDEANIEHIFPKKPSTDWQYPELLEPLLWHLGNLTMLGERLNNAARSKAYPEKRDENYKTSELVMVQEIVKTYEKWDVTSIEQRATVLGPLINEIWNFENPSRV